MIAGILLAAGSARRFGGDKLLGELAAGQCVAEVACARLRPAVDRLLAVVRPEATELAARLAAAGAQICVFVGAEQGMGASLAYGVRQASDANGWLIALADMPGIATADAVQVAAALRAGASIAVPRSEGRRGHPVGFARPHGAALMALAGDRGARSILEKNAADIVDLAAAPSANWLDIDRADDLLLARQAFDRSPARG
jgi:molybdenum cofactor cytidylyltransferase